MKIFSGSESQELTNSICKLLNKELKKYSSFEVVDEEIKSGNLKTDKNIH